MLDNIKNKIIIGTLVPAILTEVKIKFEKASENGAKYLSTHSFTPIAYTRWGRKNNVVNNKNNRLYIQTTLYF